MNVLIIEDNIAQAESLALVFRACGHTPYTAPTALGAQLIAETHSPDAVILDLILPAGGGREFLEWLRGRPETVAVPVVVLTGLPAERLGFLDGEPNLKVLEKPATPAKLFRALGIPEPGRESER